MKTFRVLIVCTANMCRSPLAEFLLRSELSKHWGEEQAEGWSISSAGTAAMQGASMHPLAAQVLSESGIVPEPFESRVLTAEMVHDADLILTATRDHRAKAVTLSPSSVRRTFTLRQFSKLVAATEITPQNSAALAGQEMVRRAILGRSRLQPLSAAHENLSDPIGKRVDAFRDCAKTIKECIDELLRASPLSR